MWEFEIKTSFSSPETSAVGQDIAGETSTHVSYHWRHVRLLDIYSCPEHPFKVSGSLVCAWEPVWNQPCWAPGACVATASAVATLVPVKKRAKIFIIDLRTGKWKNLNYIVKHRIKLNSGAKTNLNRGTPGFRILAMVIFNVPANGKEKASSGKVTKDDCSQHNRMISITIYSWSSRFLKSCNRLPF